MNAIMNRLVFLIFFLSLLSFSLYFSSSELTSNQRNLRQIDPQNSIPEPALVSVTEAEDNGTFPNGTLSPTSQSNTDPPSESNSNSTNSTSPPTPDQNDSSNMTTSSAPELPPSNNITANETITPTSDNTTIEPSNSNTLPPPNPSNETTTSPEPFTVPPISTKPSDLTNPPDNSTVPPETNVTVSPSSSTTPPPPETNVTVSPSSSTIPPPPETNVTVSPSSFTMPPPSETNSTDLPDSNVTLPPPAFSNSTESPSAPGLTVSPPSNEITNGTLAPPSDLPNSNTSSPNVTMGPTITPTSTPTLTPTLTPTITPTTGVPSSSTIPPITPSTTNPSTISPNVTATPDQITVFNTRADDCVINTVKVKKGSDKQTISFSITPDKSRNKNQNDSSTGTGDKKYLVGLTVSFASVTSSQLFDSWLLSNIKPDAGVSINGDVLMVANGVSSSESRSFGAVFSSLASIDWKFTCKYSSNYTKVNDSLKISLGLQGDKAKWNSKLFLEILAKVMGVLPSQIKILFSTFSKRSETDGSGSGSERVERDLLQAEDNMKVEFEVSGDDAAAKGSQFLSQAKIDNQLLQEAGVKVTSSGAEVSTPALAPTPDSNTPSPGSPTPTSENRGREIVAVIVFAAIFGAVLIGIAVFVLVFRGRKEIFDVEMM